MQRTDLIKAHLNGLVYIIDGSGQILIYVVNKYSM